MHAWFLAKHFPCHLSLFPVVRIAYLAVLTQSIAVSALLSPSFDAHHDISNRRKQFGWGRIAAWKRRTRTDVRTDGRQRRKARIESRLPHKSKASAMALPGVALLPLPASPDLPFVRCPPNIFLGGAQLHPNSRFGPLYLSLTLWLCA